MSPTWCLHLFAAALLLAPGQSLVGLAEEPGVKSALLDVAARRDALIEEWIRIAEIPAPSGAEAARADYVEAGLRRFAAEVSRDAAGNVIALVRGTDPALPKVAFLAHLDTVAPAEADHKVKRLPGGRLSGPGVRDDSSGLAGVLAAFDLMRSHGLRPRADTFVVATVQEEVGLRGATRFVQDHAVELGAVVAVDGTLGQVSYAATSIAWLKLHFDGPGAHTLKSHEKPSTVLAAARAIERISAISLKRSPESEESWLNIGMIGGGEVPNAQARDAWFTVDLRSNDAALFQTLERQVVAIGERTAREVGVSFEVETLQRMPGFRPKGAEDSHLVRSAVAVLTHLGWGAIQVTPRGTAEHNVALARGIPGIAIGITSGDGAHTPEEFADVEPFVTGVRQVILLALMPLTGSQ